MYIRRKVFSVGIDEYGKEKLFSVNEIISEEEYCQRIFAEAEDEEERKSKSRRIAKGAGVGALTTTGVAGVGAAGVYGANKFAGKAADILKSRRMVKLDDARKATNAALEEHIKATTADELNEAYKENLRKAEKKLDRARKQVNKLNKESNIEKGLAALQRGSASATKWVKANPKLAAGIAAGTIATGAAVGAGTAALTGKKKQKNK